MTEGQTVDKPIEIHPSAVVDPKAELASGVVIGPGAVIGPDVVIGANSWIGPHAVLDGRLTLGRDNKVFPGACLGLEPQDLKYRGADTEVVIGDGNTFRECVTIKPPTWAIASTISTPGIKGRSGKCPWNCGSFIVTFLIAVAETPGSWAITRSTRANG